MGLGALPAMSLPCAQGRWHGFAVTEGLCLAAMPKQGFTARLGIDTRRTAAWNWVGLRAPHLRSLFYEKSDQKRATRSLWSNPLYCPFSGRRAQSPAVIVTGHNTPSWLLYGAPFMPPRKRAQGFDVALYRRGAGRLSAAEVGFAASRTPRCHAPPSKKTKRYHRIACRAAGKANSVGSLVQRELPRRG